MNKFENHSLPCPCGESSDAYAMDHQGDGYCFSCKKYFKGDRLSEPVDPDVVDVTFDYYKYRGLSDKTVKFYDIKTRFHDGEPFARGFVYPNGSVKSKKYKPLSRRDKYEWKGETAPGLYGKDKFNPKDYKNVYITEGEDDAPSIYQALGGSSASVSVQSSSSAVRDITADREYLNQFDRIILAFDADEQGREAVKKVNSSGLFDFNKLYYVDFQGAKDANQFLQDGNLSGLLLSLKTAKKYTPDNIISTFSEIEEALKVSKEDIIGTYPTDALNNFLYGLHRGQVVVVKGQEGIGKTEIFRMMEYHLLKTTTCKMALIHMEEDKSTTIKGVATYELSVPCALPDSNVSDETIFKAYRAACNESEDRIFIYTLFGGDDPSDVLDSIRFTVSSGGVDIVFLDHITMLVTGEEEGDERRKLDYLSTKLKKMAKELKFCLVLISHVNDDGQTRGSRNITKIADTVIDLSRDKLHEDPYEQNLLYLAVEKNRMAGRTGKLPPLFFNTETFKLEETT